MENYQNSIIAGESISAVLRQIRADIMSRPIPLRAPFDTGSMLQRLSDIEQDYDRVAHFMAQGYDDAERDTLCAHLYRRCFELAGDLRLCRLADMNASFIKASASAHFLKEPIESLQARLEAFTQDVALLTLMPDGGNAERRQSIYTAHSQLADHLFGAMLAAPQWNADTAQHYASMLMSPTLDQNDTLLAIAALMLSLLTTFDTNKWLLLVRLWRESGSAAVAQRAFVAWAVTTPQPCDERIGELNPLGEVRRELYHILDDDTARRDLLELQIQIFHCLSAEADGKRLQEEIMPELIKHSNIRMENGKITEIDDDPMDDILPHSDSTDAMEKIEKSLQQLMDMQTGGADIYFNGFRQMKRFPFFSVLSNWFLPFYAEHPSLHSDNEVTTQLIRVMASQQQFCESDKYSVALAFKQMAPRMGKIGEKMAEIYRNAPTDMPENPKAIRRSFLQDLYRFFSVCPAHVDFPNPFADPNRAFFFASRSFPVESLAIEAEQLASFLYKRHLYGEIVSLYNAIDSYSTPLLRTLAAGALQKTGHSQEALSLSAELLVGNPGTPFLLGCHASAAKSLGLWSEAARSFAMLMSTHQDNQRVVLSLSTCLLRSGKVSEALPHLQRLYYEHPENIAAVATLVEANLTDHAIDDAISVASSVEMPQDLSRLSEHAIAAYRQIAIRHYYALVLKGNLIESRRIMGQALTVLFTGDAEALNKAIRADSRLQQHLHLSAFTMDLSVKIAAEIG